MKILWLILIFIFSAAAYSQSATVISEKANLRGEPSSTGRIVTEVIEGTSVEVIRQKGPWFLVQAKENVGWIHGNTISLSSSLPSSIRTLSTTPVYKAPSAPARSVPTSTRSTASGGPYFTGPRGGCYYINSHGNKTYVDHSNCH